MYKTKGPTSEINLLPLLGHLLGKKGPSGFGSKSTAINVVAKWEGAGKTAIITGGNTGLGKESAGALASRGCEVILAVRDTKKGAEAAEDITAKYPAAKVSVMELDLSSLNSVRAFAAAYKRTGKPLHVLMCNAGIMACPFELSADKHELQFATNHLGHFLLVRGMSNGPRDMHWAWNCF
jgi:NAD(P)-dependent dehydrogenase (short-subunit alcohol dehydrogenase family)